MINKKRYEDDPPTTRRDNGCWCSNWGNGTGHGTRVGSGRNTVERLLGSPSGSFHGSGTLTGAGNWSGDGTGLG